MFPTLLDVPEVADLLNLSPQAVRLLLRQGKLAGRKVGGVWLVDPRDANRYGSEVGALPEPRPKPSTRRKRSAQMSGLSFFSGAMGLDLGLERAGIKTTLACEFDKWSKRTIAANRPDLPLIGDIWEHDSTSIRELAGLGSGDAIDLVAGGPPCQAFSTAGARRGFDDERGNVFLHFVELALDLEPRYIVIENVRGLLSAPMKHRPHSMRGRGFPVLADDELPGGALRFVLHLLREGGYTVTFNLYNAANFGVPQTRERVIIIASRDGGPVGHLCPTHSDNEDFGLPPWNTFRDAVADLNIDEHQSLEFPENRLKYYRLLGPGQHWRHLPLDLQKEALGNSFYSGGGKTGFLRRLAWDRPSPTLVTHPAMPATDLAHPEFLRPLSIQEYKRIQQFPDDWILEGPLVQKYKQVGNAVPVGLGHAAGRAIVAHAQGKVLPVPSGFRFSRYRETDEETWGRPVARRKVRNPNDGSPTLF